MDNLSDSLRGELDSVTSSESLQLITDEFRLKHAFTPDVSNVELSKRIALLELENERLRIDLENTRIDSDARIAANQGLKGKITELYVEVQSVMQDKQKLQNSLMEVNSRLTAAETSTNWYKSQLHNAQADRKSLQVEIDTYQRILRQRQQAVVDLTARYKQLNTDYTELMQKHQREKQELQEEIRTLKLQSLRPDVIRGEELLPSSPQPDLSTKLETTEDELRGTKNELKSLEQRLLSSEAAKLSLENVLSKQRGLISNMEETIQRDAAERNESTSMLHKAQFDVQRLTSENKFLQTSLLSSQQEQRQIEDVINQLRSQLTKMLAQYKLLKSRNTELDEKLVSMQNLVDENKRLKSLAHKANASLIEKLRQEKRKTKFLERRIHKEKEQFIGNMKTKMEPSLIMCLKQALARNKDLNERLKSLSKSSDESIDEGYGDSSVLSSISNYSAVVDIPSPPPLNPLFIHSVNSILSNNSTLLTPVQTKLNELKLKMETLRDRCTVVVNKQHNNVSYESTSIVSPIT